MGSRHWENDDLKTLDNEEMMTVEVCQCGEGSSGEKEDGRDYSQLALLKVFFAKSEMVFQSQTHSCQPKYALMM